ncbi:hypothetical protein GCM10007877_08420 [Marinibactrum halimedae]|uniref:Uncharacterized protein n=1 Tax=Marinibactrum halimedae TaxID=1444977 RepID=A0AA37WKP3_9GAMM|nr:hypothetical protein GCM10007877_08420 [Marinibactrum halimedae]
MATAALSLFASGECGGLALFKWGLTHFGGECLSGVFVFFPAMVKGSALFIASYHSACYSAGWAMVRVVVDVVWGGVVG